MRLILTFLLLCSFNVRSQTLSFTDCDPKDRTQTFYVDFHPRSTYEWSVSGSVKYRQDQNKITVTFNTARNFVISVIETNSSGCKGSEKKAVIEFTPCETEVMWIPSSFTPNGDGLNDKFYVLGNFDAENFTLEIFNRWGESIFFTHDQQMGWDGFYNGGVVQNEVYVYKVSWMMNGKLFSKIGSVTVIK